MSGIGATRRRGADRSAPPALPPHSADGPGDGRSFVSDRGGRASAIHAGGGARRHQDPSSDVRIQIIEATCRPLWRRSPRTSRCSIAACARETVSGGARQGARGARSLRAPAPCPPQIASACSTSRPRGNGRSRHTGAVSATRGWERIEVPSLRSRGRALSTSILELCKIRMYRL